MRITNVRAHNFILCKPMAFKLASRFAQKYRRPYNEMADEALHALGRELTVRLESFNPELSRLSTWLYQAVYWHLLTICLEESKRRGCEAPLSELIEQEIQSSPGSYLDGIREGVDDDGQELLDVIFTSSISQNLSPRAPTRTRRIIYKHLKANHGWSEDRIEAAFSQLESCVVGADA